MFKSLAGENVTQISVINKETRVESLGWVFYQCLVLYDERMLGTSAMHYNLVLFHSNSLLNICQKLAK